MPRTSKVQDYDYGDLMTIDRFKEAVEGGSFIDYDGFGHAVRGDEVDESRYYYPSEVAEIPEDVTHVLWFNR